MGDDSYILRIHGISKSFGDTRVLRDLSFDVARGEFLTVLGSSGCGKTTLLRILCGLEEADCGQIFLDGRDVTSVEPNLREVNTVFQSYALFPHMTVFDNVAYPLRIARPRKTKAEIRAAVADALALVRMTGYERRYPSALSGGQRQRIAIARAVIARPRVLLLDEPLGALDLNLRRQMQSELKNLQKSLGITFIYITHDQEEALNMSDRIAVMHDGHFLQLGTPSEIYDSPKSVYVARFVGEANILPCTFVGTVDGDSAEVDFGGVPLIVRRGSSERTYRSGDLVHAALRGERIQLSENGSGSAVSGPITGLRFAGGVLHLTFDRAGTQLTAVRYGLDTSLRVGDTVRCEIPDRAAVLCESDEEVRS
ncbi:MAG: ABC transporter ATP-binding protein [Eubacteriales bacterium]